MRLPLLVGLLVVSSGETTCIIQEALKEEKSFQIIQYAVRAWVRRIRCRIRNRAVSKSNQGQANDFRNTDNVRDAMVRPSKRLKRTSSETLRREKKDGSEALRAFSLQYFDTLHHWWWKALISYVDAERSAAAQYLVKACCNDHDKFILVRPLMLLLEALVQRITNHNTHEKSDGNLCSVVPLSRRFVGEILALLDQVMPTSSAVMAAQQRWNILQRFTNHVMHLATCGQSGMLWTTLAAQDCLRGLLSFLQKWLLVVEKNSIGVDLSNRHLHIWVPAERLNRTYFVLTGQFWSPLAALLAAFATTKASMHWLNSSKEPPRDLILSTLHRLLDPEARRVPRLEKQLPTIAPSAATTRHTRRIISSTSSNPAAASHGSSNRTAPPMATYQARLNPSPPSPAANPPPSRLSEDDDDDDDDDDDEVLVVEDEAEHDDDDDLIMEEAEIHEDQAAGVTGQYREEENKDRAPVLHPVESDDDDEDLDHDDVDDDDDCDDDEILIPRGHEDHDIPIEGEDDDEDDEGEEDDDDNGDDDLENLHVDYHPLVGSSGAESRLRARGLSPSAHSASARANPSDGNRNDHRPGNDVSDASGNEGHVPPPLCPPLPERRKAFVEAAMHVMAQQYSLTGNNSIGVNLSVDAENYLLESVNQIIRPPKKPVTTKIIMRRAPTQEEFFRGTLSRNPISIDSLTPAIGDEPTVGDLRQHIANDLQMADSAELIEILVANKIVDVSLRLRLIHQVLWKRHLMENSTASGSSASFLSMGSGFSMIFSHGRGSGGGGITADTPASHLPPMIAMYRLAGVDGEATEDTVSELVDPEAAVKADSVEEQERLLEKEYGLTRTVLEQRGVHILLRSIQRNIADTLQRIRRDDVSSEDDTVAKGNHERARFRSCAACQALTLMRHCTRLTVNHKKLLQAHAPTVLLTLLLDVLKALEEPGGGNTDTTSNPTADLLQELIESLTSDITEVGSGFEDEETAQDASSLPLLLDSIETTSLGAPLRNVIAKLLPFLTYGQTDLSRFLAKHFDRHIVLPSLSDREDQADENILMNTFVETAISLPPNEVCNALRSSLVECGFVDSLCGFILKDMPEQPPTWSVALWPKGKKPEKTHDAWRAYVKRDGIRTAFKIAASLCKQHAATQISFCRYKRFVQFCHWLEATSDNLDLDISMDGLGLLAETLLDEFVAGTGDVKKSVDAVRQATRVRKKELAQERRDKALGKMGSFGPEGNQSPVGRLTTVRDTASSALAPVLGFFRDPTNSKSSGSRKRKAKGSEKEKPEWLMEMETIEEETGLVCVCCQEGRVSQPSELLGLYAFVRKVAIPLDKCGSRASIDGSVLLNSLPSYAPLSFGAATQECEEWYPVGKAAGEDLSPTTSICTGSGSSRRSSVFTTTVSAGNGIHVSCHVRARQVDRSHPKAPKSEWEGAKLRNGRVDCNIILPLVSSRSSKVSLIAVDSALSEHQTAVSNLLGATPKSMLWTTLYDVYFLLLRMSYGEPLNGDCGGGSLASNCQLLLYEMLTADMFEKNAQVDQPEQSQHALGLSSGFLAACAILLSAGDSDFDKRSLTIGIADAAPMACLTCILFHNSYDDSGSGADTLESIAHPKRRWVVGRNYFLKGLILCAGRRKALGVENSGCLATRGSRLVVRPSSFVEWDTAQTEQKQGRGACLSEYQHSLRPLLTFFAFAEQLSVVFSSSMEEDSIGSHAEILAMTVEDCLRCKNIDELLTMTKVDLDPQEIAALFKSGLAAA
ncbi:hypothetical protein ACA910_012973 [Epithemia clementina (nom. ined.)]